VTTAQKPTDLAQNDAIADTNAATAMSNSGETTEQAGERTPSVCLGTNLHSGTEVHWPLTVKGNPHLLVAGLPGMGKTTCLLNLCRQMLELEIRPIVFSYHQDIDEKLQQMVGAVRFIDFQGLGFNPLQVLDRRSPMAHLDVAGAVRDIFTATFPELGDIQGERIRKAIKDSFVEQGWGDPSVDQAELIEPSFSRFVEILRAEPKPDRGLKTLLSRLEELSDYGFFQSADVQESLWDSEQPVVLRIHATQNDNLQKAFSSLVFYGLYKNMFRRGPRDRITHALIFDEAHRAARLQLIPTMAKECRKYGISLVLASQEARDFNVSLYSAIANFLVLRLNETDAKVLARNVASSDQERTLIDRIKQMDRFKAYYCSEGQKKPIPIVLQP
jgi:DNA polymerase III delta prime subunit